MYKLLLEKINSAPLLPGCYLYKDTDGKVLYVGKGKNLRTRVRQYFQEDVSKEPKIEVMIPQITDVEFVTVGTETEALVLEANLIKKYRPKYNKLQKDDKRYAWIKITNESIPRVYRVREKKKDGAKYYGPYPDGGAAARTLRFLRKLYPYRVCKKKMFYPNGSDMSKKSSRLCLDYHLGLCLGPCDNLISESKYNENIQHIHKFLIGHRTELIRDLSERMKRYSLTKEYEKAAMVRDRINELGYITQKINVRFGEDEEKVRDKKKKEAKDVAEQLFQRFQIKNKSGEFRIECYDVSNIQGTTPITSMVVFKEGLSDKSAYRYFNIRSKDTPDDYAMMKEGLVRRLKYLVDSDKRDTSFSFRPDLIIVDGGKGQLGTALETIKEFDLDVPVIGLAKREEEILQRVYDKYQITRLRRDSKTLHLIQQLRDEAHRFAISQHRNLRSKKATKSLLDNIPGVGDKTIVKLLKAFGSVDNIAKQDLSSLIEVVGNQSIAVNVFEYFR